MPAVNLALDDVNHEKNLLPGFTLKLHSNDSEVYRETINRTNGEYSNSIFLVVRARTRRLGDVQFTILQSTQVDVAGGMQHGLHDCCRGS